MDTTQYGVATDTGRRREHNEDSYYLDPPAGLFVVSDGMGGYKGGEVASALAVQTIAEAVLAGRPLERAVASAHDAILSASQQGVGARGMGATVVALRLTGSDYEIAWVGDSRVYLWDGADGALRQLTRDHSLVQQLLDAGTLTPQEAKNHPKGNVVTQALGALDMSEVVVDTVTGRLYAGQQLLLCSDGLTGELDDADIADQLRQGGTAQEIAEWLVDTANGRGGRDNITVILVPAPPEAPSRPERGDTGPMDTRVLNRLTTKGKKNPTRNKIVAALIVAALLLALAAGYWLL